MKAAIALHKIGSFRVFIGLLIRVFIFPIGEGMEIEKYHREFEMSKIL
jgi:hypothetical protein